jgi:hypothetical protein
MEVGQRLAVIEPAAFRHEGFDQIEDAVGAIGEAVQHFVRVDAAVVAALVEPVSARAASSAGGR